MGLVLSHWSASWPFLIACLAVAGAHLTGLLLLGRDAAPGGAAGRSAALREAAVFQAGLLAAAGALLSPVAYWSGTYIWVRAAQAIVLGVVAPALIVLGVPWTALGRCLGRRPGAFRGGDGPGPGAGAAPSRPPWWLSRPVVVVLAFNVTWLAWNVPALLDLVPVSRVAAAAEYVTYLGAGTLFWLQLIGSRPFSPTAGPLRRAVFLVGTVAADTVLGMVLVFGSGVLYPAYANAAHHVLTVVDDQQVAGAVLWMGVLPALITAAVALLLRWLSDDESGALPAGTDRLLTPRNSGWPSRPRLR
jgi:cytochrome c oxidase assembly factor CtaG